jgi:hypothetical protein
MIQFYPILYKYMINIFAFIINIYVYTVLYVSEKFIFVSVEKIKIFWKKLIFIEILNEFETELNS